MFVFVDVPNEPTQCGPHIFRWRQHLTVKNQAGDFLKWKGKEKIALGSDKTRARRASTVRGWVKWILELPMAML